MPEFARQLDAIPLVRTTAERGTLFPNPVVGQRVQNLETGQFERFTANGWVGTMGAGTYNVLDFGAVGDGVTDDTVAIQNAINACSTAGGGQVYLPTGTYLVSIRVHPDNAAWAAALIIENNCTLVGAGVDATIIKLAVIPNAVPTGCSVTWKGMVTSIGTPSGGNKNVGIRDLTIDGNAANQTFVPPDSMHGVFLNRTRSAWFTRVVVKNLYGELPGPPGETTSFEASRSSDIHYTDCEAYTDDGGETSTGFSANNSTAIEYVGCIARSMGNGQGFTHYISALIRYTACHAYLCDYAGFNSEISEHITYVGCHSGGRATAASGVFTSNENLGNRMGFRVMGSNNVQILGGSASYNTNTEGYGVHVLPYTTGGTVDATDVYVDGIALIANKYGVYVADANQLRIEVGPGCRFSGNTTAAYGGSGDFNTLMRQAQAPIQEWTALNGSSGVRFNVVGTTVAQAYRFLREGTEVFRIGDGCLGIRDGMTAPDALAGVAWLYVDTADGDLKIKFPDGVVKTIATDT